MTEYSLSMLLTIIGSVASSALAIIAIWLSLYFFNRSQSDAKDIQKSSDAISNSVDKIYELFNCFYKDTFSLMRETHDKMADSLWQKSDLKLFNSNDQQIERDRSHIAKLKEEYEGKLAQLKEESEAKIEGILKELQLDKSEHERTITNLNAVIESILKDSQKMKSIKQSKSEQAIIQEIRNNTNNANANEIYENISRKMGMTLNRFIKTVEAMRDKGIVEMDDPFLEPGTHVYLCESYEEKSDDV